MKRNKALSEFEAVVFAHSLINPPSQNRSNVVDLILKNSQKVTLKKEGEVLQTQYRLSITTDKRLAEQSDRDNFFSDAVLAFNLLLDTTALWMFRQSVNNYDFHRKGTKSEIEKNSELSEIVVDDDYRMITAKDEIVLDITEKDHVATISKETIDENKIIRTLNIINKADRHQAPHANTPFQKKQKMLNLKKALDNYEAAMSIFDMRFIFRDLFMSLEMATNWDQGRGRKGEALDAEIAKLTMIPQTRIYDWHTLYNRLKHPDEKQEHLIAFEKGIKKLPSKIEPLRFACKKVILQRLKSL